MVKGKGWNQHQTVKQSASLEKIEMHGYYPLKGYEMKKRKYRITVNLSPEIIDTLEQIKQLTGTTYSTQIYEMLNEIHPALKLLVRNIEIARGMEAKSKEELKAALDEISPNIADLSKQAQALTDAADGQLDLLDKFVGGDKRDGD